MSIQMPPKVKSKRFSVDKYPALKALLDSKLSMGWSHRDEHKAARQQLLPQCNMLLGGTGVSLSESQLSSWFKHRTYTSSKPSQSTPKVVVPSHPPKITSAAIYQGEGENAEVQIVIDDGADVFDPHTRISFEDRFKRLGHASPNGNQVFGTFKRLYYQDKRLQGHRPALGQHSRACSLLYKKLGPEGKRELHRIASNYHARCLGTVSDEEALILIQEMTSKIQEMVKFLWLGLFTEHQRQRFDFMFVTSQDPSMIAPPKPEESASSSSDGKDGDVEMPEGEDKDDKKGTADHLEALAMLPDPDVAPESISLLSSLTLEGGSSASRSDILSVPMIARAATEQLKALKGHVASSASNIKRKRKKPSEDLPSIDDDGPVSNLARLLTPAPGTLTPEVVAQMTEIMQQATATVEIATQAKKARREQEAEATASDQVLESMQNNP